MRGFSRLTASDQFSALSRSGPTASCAGAVSVGTRGAACSQLRSSRGSTRTRTCTTVSGTLSRPCRACARR